MKQHLKLSMDPTRAEITGNAEGLDLLIDALMKAKATGSAAIVEEDGETRVWIARVERD